MSDEQIKPEELPEDEYEAEQIRGINRLGLLSLVGFVGLLGFFTESNRTLIYLYYFSYAYYFFIDPTRDLTRIMLRSATTAFFSAFTVNMTFVIAAQFSSSIDYRTGFYLSYLVGSIVFPSTFTVLEIFERARQARTKKDG